ARPAEYVLGAAQVAARLREAPRPRGRVLRQRLDRRPRGESPRREAARHLDRDARQSHLGGDRAHRRPDRRHRGGARMSEPIDLRSDTVTRPTPAMREAIAAAPVGDDQYGEDPTTNRLQERVASLLGKAASLFLPSGTMANQVALRVLTQPGDDVIVSPESHAVWHETGGSAANAGVQFTTVGARGVFTAEEFAAAVKPRGHVIFPQADAVKVCAAARERGIATYLDGARLWNVAAATGTKLADLAAPFDLVGVALSKGLGAPGGSLLAGSKELVARCVRHRRMLGGAMRQSGILSAAGLYALDHNLERLRDDHANAHAIATTLAASKRVILDLATVQTNIVVFHLTPEAPDGPAVVARAKERSVLVYAFGPRTVRLVTHLDVSAAQCATAAGILRSVVDG